jgi:hypothetical protein
MTPTPSGSHDATNIERFMTWLRETGRNDSSIWPHSIADPIER